MPAAQRHAPLIGHRHDIVRVNVLQEKTHQPGPARFWPEQSDVVQPRKLIVRVGRQVLVVPENVLAPDAVQVIHRGMQSDRTGDVRRAGLELVRRVFVARLVKIDAQNHLPAPLPGRHGLEQFLPAVKHADARRPANLVAREGQEITPDLPDIHRTMSRALRRVDERHDAQPARTFAQLLDRIHRAERIGNVNHREQLHILHQERVKFAQVEQPFVARHGKINQLRPRSLGQHLPGNDIAVMLHFRQQNLVARLQVPAAPRRGHQVDGFGRPAGEDDFVGISRVDELRRPSAGCFECRCRPIAQFMDAAMDVGIVPLVVASQCVEHHAGLLARRRIVEINQRLAVDFLK